MDYNTRRLSSSEGVKDDFALGAEHSVTQDRHVTVTGLLSAAQTHSESCLSSDASRGDLCWPCMFSFTHQFQHSWPECATRGLTASAQGPHKHPRKSFQPVSWCSFGAFWVLSLPEQG